MPALEKLSIDTPEQVALEFSLATVGSRFLALAIDTLIQVACAAVLFAGVGLAALAAQVSAGGPSPWLAAVVVIGLFLIYYAYFAIFESVWNGQTPGKRAIGLRVIHMSGRPVGVFEAILRNIVRIADQFPGIYAIGIVSMFLTERSQRLGDLAAGTVVVHEQAGSRGREFVPEAATPGVATTHHGASKLTPAELSVLELFLRRRGQLDGDVRVRAAARVADRMRERLGITATVENERLLEELVAEHKARGRFR